MEFDDEPETASQQGSGLESKLFQPTWIPFKVVYLGIFVGQIIAIWILHLDGSGSNEIAIGLGLAFAMAQSCIAAIWITLMPYSLGARVIFSTVSISIAVLGTLGLVVNGNADEKFVLPLTTSMAVLCCLIQLPLWHARSKGWRLTSGYSKELEAGATQFGIKQLFVLTSVIAVIAAIFKALFGAAKALKGDMSTSTEPIALCTLLVLAAFMTLCPVIWGSFVQKHRLRWLVIMLVWSIAMTWVEMYFMKQLISGVSDQDLPVIATINLGQAFSIFLVLLSLRVADMRLQRI